MNLNAPGPEFWALEEGQKRLEEVQETSAESTCNFLLSFLRFSGIATFIFRLEDHTIGNIVRINLLKDKQNVAFAGYKKGHPLINNVEVKVMSKPEEPRATLLKCLKDIRDQVSDIKSDFVNQLKEFQQARNRR
jgi:DNA-directed RNA polymerase subunit L